MLCSFVYKDTFKFLHKVPGQPCILYESCNIWYTVICCILWILCILCNILYIVLGALYSRRPPSNCHGYHSLLLPSLSLPSSSSSSSLPLPLPSSSSSLPTQLSVPQSFSSQEKHLMITRYVDRAALFIRGGRPLCVTLWCQDSFGPNTLSNTSSHFYSHF